MPTWSLSTNGSPPQPWRSPRTRLAWVMEAVRELWPQHHARRCNAQV
jgi:hypothetical protein